MSYDPKTTIGQVVDSAADSGKLLQVNSTGGIIAVTGTGGATGAAGAPGSVWYQGASVPSSGTGINGDYYLRLNPGGSGDGDVYQKASGAWSVGGNIKGPAGIQGVIGATGPQGIQGVQGVQGVAGAAGAAGQGYLWRGAWSGGTVYAAYDSVLYAGSAYVAVAGSTNVTPGTDATKWNLFAQGSADSVMLANVQTGTTYTLVLSDAGKAVECNNASAVTLTIPPVSSVAWPIGTVAEIFQYGAGQVSITAGAGVTLRSDGGKTKIAGRYGSAGLRMRANDEWVLSGDLST